MFSESLESEDRVVWLNYHVTHLIRLIGGREGGRGAEVEREGGKRRDVEREGGEEIKRVTLLHNCITA